MRTLKPNSHAIAFGECPIGLDRLLDQRSDIDATEIEDDPSGLHLLDIENVVDEPHQALAVAVRDRKQTGHRMRQVSGRIAHEKAERAGYRSQRRAQLMAHRRDEFVLQSVQALALGDIFGKNDDPADFLLGAIPGSNFPF